MTTLGLQIWVVLVTLVLAHAFQSHNILSGWQHHRVQLPPFPARISIEEDTPRPSKPSVSLQATTTISDHAPTWKDLHTQLLSTPTGSRLQQEANDRAEGLGPPHTDALLRLFPDNINNNKYNNSTEDDVQVTLYRDQAGWCPYCQKVWLFLEQKQIPYRVKKVPLNAYGDKPAWFTRKVDGGKLPAIEIKMSGTDGDTFLQVESIEIMKLLEQAFPNHGPRMIPAVPNDKNASHDNNEHAKMKALLDLEQELQQAWFLLVFYPVKDEALAKANQTFVDTLTKVNEALSHTKGPWFLEGNNPSFVDIQYITTMERIAASVLYWKGLNIRSLDNLPQFQTWLAAFERLPHYLASRSDYYTHVMAIPSQNGPGFLIPSAKLIANRISGLSGAWDLPLDPETCLEPMPGPTRLHHGTNSDKDAYSACHEAAHRLIENHANIVLFACRGAGEPGRPSFHAELADPYAEPNEDYLQAVDVALRHVVNALLHGLPPKDKTDGYINNIKTAVESLAKQDLSGTGGSNELRENWEAYPDNDDPSLTYYYNYETGDATWTPPTQQLDTCLTYLRDRIGVPRDMGPAAAMELRAHLNWGIALMQADS